MKSNVVEVKPNDVVPEVTQEQKIALNFFLSTGGLGDYVARLPAIKYVMENASHIEKALIVCPEFFVPLANNALAKFAGRLTAVKEASNFYPIMETNEQFHSTIRTHVTDHAFHLLADMHPENNEQRNYLPLDLSDVTSPLDYPGRYAVITTGYTAKAREWLPEQVNAVTKYLRFKYGIMPVFLGKHGVAVGLKGEFNEEIDYDFGINLIDKTTLLEAAKIMSGAQLVIGLDNGLLHVAAMTDVPIIAGYSSIDPKYRLPYRHGEQGWNCEVIVPTTPCRFVQTRGFLRFGVDFRECDCGDYRCLKSMKPSFWLKAIDRVLAKKDK